MQWSLVSARDFLVTTGGKFAIAGQQIAGASENFVLNY
jgi:hypothetical protein